MSSKSSRLPVRCQAVFIADQHRVVDNRHRDELPDRLAFEVSRSGALRVIPVEVTFDLHADRLERTMPTLIGNPADLADELQEVFVTINRHFQSLVFVLSCLP